jgi:hypothetical protein
MLEYFSSSSVCLKPIPLSQFLLLAKNLQDLVLKYCDGGSDVRDWREV